MLDKRKEEKDGTFLFCKTRTDDRECGKIRFWCDRYCFLTKKGHEQAMQTGEKILADKLEADEILYSPLMRAADTAKHIAKITGIPARMEPRLKEQNFENGSQHQEMVQSFKKQKCNFLTAMMAENLCSG